MERVFHNLSKGARYDILSILLERRGKKELATELGVSPALITKYINKVTHPSDEVMSKNL
ncbi:helix-turn-helix domain-containing protein [Sulfuracidifex metallicus]|uniref:helix-turn-helix domain-containing protein n=1 Tax=Sulfuracidifex metallicus TaxID=47303 RepID=UPI0006D27223|nr:helix-turn-helix transcriptional regulator [Sulfuracidifex metallicus]